MVPETKFLCFFSIEMFKRQSSLLFGLCLVIIAIISDAAPPGPSTSRRSDELDDVGRHCREQFVREFQHVLSGAARDDYIVESLSPPENDVTFYYRFLKKTFYPLQSKECIYALNSLCDGRWSRNQPLKTTFNVVLESEFEPFWSHLNPKCYRVKLTLRYLSDKQAKSMTTVLRKSHIIYHFRILTTWEHDSKDPHDLISPWLEAIADNPGIITLSLREYALKEKEFKALVSMIRRSKSLKTLDLSRTPISEFDFESFASAISCNPALESLDLSECEICGLGISQLASHLKSNSLKSLDISGYNNSPSHTKLGLLKALARSEHLRELNVAGFFCSDMYSSYSKQMAESIASIATIEILEITLKSGYFEYRDFKFVQQLAKMKNLRRWTIDGYLGGLGTSSIIELADMLRQNNRLEHLSINGQREQCDYSYLFKVLRGGSLFFKVNNVLVSLSFEFCDFDEKTWDALLQALRCNKTLKKLRIKGLNCAKTFASVGAFLQENRHLKEFRYAPTCWSRETELDDTRKAFFDGLINNTALECFELSDCDLDINQKDTRRFFDHLSSSSCRLKKLTLSQCRIRGKSALALAKAISTNQHLKHLDLTRNYFSSTAIWYFALLMKKNSCLEVLDLSHNVRGFLDESCFNDNEYLGYLARYFEMRLLLTPKVYDLVNDHIPGRKLRLTVIDVSDSESDSEDEFEKDIKPMIRELRSE
jgi:hypothetical protein